MISDDTPAELEAQAQRAHRSAADHRTRAEHYRRQAGDEESNAERLDHYAQDLAALLDAEAKA